MTKLLKAVLDMLPAASKKYTAAAVCGLIVLFKQELQLDEQQISDMVLICSAYIGSQAVVDTALVVKDKK